MADAATEILPTSFVPADEDGIGGFSDPSAGFIHEPPASFPGPAEAALIAAVVLPLAPVLVTGALEADDAEAAAAAAGKVVGAAAAVPLPSTVNSAQLIPVPLRNSSTTAATGRAAPDDCASPSPKNPAAALASSSRAFTKLSRLISLESLTCSPAGGEGGGAKRGQRE